MKNSVLVSNLITEVKSNGSVTTNKPSTASMSIDHRFAISAKSLFMDTKGGEEKEIGLVRLELYAVYDDGMPDDETQDES